MNRNKEHKIEEKIALFNDVNQNVSTILKNISLTENEVEDDEISNDEDNVILDVKNIQKYYTTSKKVLDEITFKVNTGEFFGIVGESGSGKSTLGKIIIRIIQNSGGTILFDNEFISSKKLLKSTRKWLAKNIQMVFQSPINSLNPKKKVLELVKEPLLRSDMISKKVDYLIDLHKILNYVFKYRMQDIIENDKIEFNKKYYSVLMFSYFTFLIKFYIYEYYVKSTQNIEWKDKFLQNISALYNKYSENKDLFPNKNGFLGPLYKLDSIIDLNIYDSIALTQEQKSILWTGLINDDELLDFYGINLTSRITNIKDFFEDLNEADEYITNAVDQLDNDVKLTLSTATKYFTNVTDLTRIILKKITKKDFFPKEKEMFELANSLQEAKNLYEKNSNYEKISKIITKKNKMLSDFNAIYKDKTGLNAKNILITYLSTSKEEISSVNRSLVNNSKDPIMFMYYLIKKCTLKERYNVIKTLNKIKNLTSLQIDFLIEKVWGAIKEKYDPLFKKLSEIRIRNQDSNIAKSEISSELNLLKLETKKKWNEYGKNLPEYKKAINVANLWSKENLTIFNNNKSKVNTQVNQLDLINKNLQSLLEKRKDQWALKARYEGCKLLYSKVVKEYILEANKVDIELISQINKKKAEVKNIRDVYDKKLMKLMNKTNHSIWKLPHLIKKNSDIYKANKDGVIQDIKRIKDGIGSTFLEIQEIIRNARTYIKLYTSSNPQFMRNSLINHLTKLYVFDTLESVGLKQEHAFRYIYEFSGGQRQRIAIARSLVTHPKLIIADEPISALDVSIQAQVVNIMKNLAKERNITFLFIAHDLSMVHYACDRMIIINKGHILEKGNTNAIFEHPGHPYTRTLLKAVPELSNINLNLALESDKVYQPYGDYNPIDKPKFYSVDQDIEHFVYGTKEQVEKWNPDLTVKE